MTFLKNIFGCIICHSNIDEYEEYEDEIIERKPRYYDIIPQKKEEEEVSPRNCDTIPQKKEDSIIVQIKEEPKVLIEEKPRVFIEEEDDERVVESRASLPVFISEDYEPKVQTITRRHSTGPLYVYDGDSEWIIS